MGGWEGAQEVVQPLHPSLRLPTLPGDKLASITALSPAALPGRVTLGWRRQPEEKSQRKRLPPSAARKSQGRAAPTASPLMRLIIMSTAM